MVIYSENLNIMKTKIKIRTMKDDLVDTENNNFSEEEQDQNKINITSKKTMASDMALPGAASDGKLKDSEVNELKDLLKKISKISEEEAPEEKQADSESSAAAKITDDKSKELRDLIAKVSKSIDLGEKTAVEAPAAEKENGIKETKEDEQSFWSDISEKLKEDKLSEAKEAKKINEIKREDQLIKKNIADIQDATEKAMIKEDSDSGILRRNELQEKEDEEKREEERSFHKINYQSPENRLIFGKQKRYSSVSKRVELKEKKDTDDIADLKNANEMKEKQAIISESEKYRKLRNRVIKKYHIKLFSLPWKKIILLSIVLVASAGAVFYLSMKTLTPTPPTPPPVIVGTETQAFAKIKNRVEFTETDAAKAGFKEITINREFELNSGVKELRVIIKQGDNITSPRDALESIGVITKNFPEDFWETTAETYSILALKTGKNTFRLAIAIESNDIASLLNTMRNWEQESVDEKKLFRVFKTIFTGDKIDEGSNQVFESTNYNYAYIKYINLPDENTSFDYFASDNTLIIAASKENAFRIIDILNANNYYDYED